LTQYTMTAIKQDEKFDSWNLVITDDERKLYGDKLMANYRISFGSSIL